MSNIIYVGNISYQMSEAELRDAFSSFGTIASVKIIQDRMTGKSRGFAFVEFASPDCAQRALDMNGKEVSGRNLYVSFPRERSSGGSRFHNGNGGGNRSHRSHY